VYTNDGLVLCNDYWGEIPEDLTLADFEEQCTENQGTESDGVWSLEACTSENRHGRCHAIFFDSYDQVTNIYDDVSLEMAEQLCLAFLDIFGDDGAWCPD
jgi:hypothetical protein